MSVRARHEASYFITFIDNFTRYDRIYLIAHKSEALDYFKKYVTEIKNQLEKKVKILRTDQGHEYLLEQFKEF